MYFFYRKVFFYSMTGHSNVCGYYYDKLCPEFFFKIVFEKRVLQENVGFRIQHSPHTTRSCCRNRCKTKLGHKHCTVKPLLMDSSIIRTPLYYDTNSSPGPKGPTIHMYSTPVIRAPVLYKMDTLPCRFGVCIKEVGFKKIGLQPAKERASFTQSTYKRDSALSMAKRKSRELPFRLLNLGTLTPPLASGHVPTFLYFSPSFFSFLF